VVIITEKKTQCIIIQKGNERQICKTHLKEVHLADEKAETEKEGKGRTVEEGIRLKDIGGIPSRKRRRYGKAKK